MEYTLFYGWSDLCRYAKLISFLYVAMNFILMAFGFATQPIANTNNDF